MISADDSYIKIKELLSEMKLVVLELYSLELDTKNDFISKLRICKAVVENSINSSLELDVIAFLQLGSLAFERWEKYVVSASSQLGTLRKKQLAVCAGLSNLLKANAQLDSIDFIENTLITAILSYLDLSIKRDEISSYVSSAVEFSHGRESRAIMRMSLLRQLEWAKHMYTEYKTVISVKNSSLYSRLSRLVSSPKIVPELYLQYHPRQIKNIFPHQKASIVFLMNNQHVDDCCDRIFDEEIKLFIPQSFLAELAGPYMGKVESFIINNHNIVGLEVSDKPTDCFPALKKNLFKVLGLLTSREQFVFLRLENISFLAGPENQEFFINAFFSYADLSLLGLMIFSSHLQTVVLLRAQLGALEAEAIKAFFSGVSEGNHFHLRHLTLSENRFAYYHKEQAQLFSHFLSLITSLELLDLSNNRFGRSKPDAAAIFLKNISTLPNLMYLNLANNYFGKVCASNFKEFVTTLFSFNKLSVLSLKNNNIFRELSLEEIKRFAVRVVDSRSLQCLNITSTDFNEFYSVPNDAKTLSAIKPSMPPRFSKTSVQGWVSNLSKVSDKVAALVFLTVVGRAAENKIYIKHDCLSKEVVTQFFRSEFQGKPSIKMGPSAFFNTTGTATSTNLIVNGYSAGYGA